MIDQALQLLKSHNYKITKQRRTMLEYLSGFRENYVNVTKIDEHMRELFPASVMIRSIAIFANLPKSAFLKQKAAPTEPV